MHRHQYRHAASRAFPLQSAHRAGEFRPLEPATWLAPEISRVRPPPALATAVGQQIPSCVAKPRKATIV
jgi:hypothetical protein